ncbi:MAG: site-specific integrase [Gemmatimonadota bacterium]
MPLPLASRWVVTHRRHRALATLRRDVQALKSFYGWAEGAIAEGLETRIESGGHLDTAELLQLVEAIRRLDPPDTDGPLAEASTVFHRAIGIRDFLLWALTPANRGQPGPPLSDYVDRENAIYATFGVLLRDRQEGDRYQPLSPSEVRQVESLIAPITDEQGSLLRPLRWNAKNPFRPASRLRNWLMWCVAYDCGFRRGELLKLTLADLPRPTDPTSAMTLRRRPNDRNDRRQVRPAVKTTERTVAISFRTAAALRAYLTERPPVGRRTGQPYLFSIRAGTALGIRASNRIMEVLGKASGIPHLTGHAIRHTWAEDLAAELYEWNRSEDAVLPILRRLGGWSPTSKTPMRYIATTLEKVGNMALQTRNRRILGESELS